MGKEVTSIRVVLDTNVLVSGFLFGGGPGKLRDWWVVGRIVPLISKETFEEFNRVLNYPKFRLTPAEISQIVEKELLPYAEVIVIAEGAAGTCRDPDDGKFLVVAACGNASYTVTGDNDLLTLESFGNARIVTVTDFLKLI